MGTYSEILVALLILLGAAFAFIGSLGLVKLPDFFKRLHAPTKATTLGVGGMILGSVVFFTLVEKTFQYQEFLVSLFLFITAPASAYIIAKAALHLKVQHEAEGVSDPLKQTTDQEKKIEKTTHEKPL